MSGPWTNRTQSWGRGQSRAQGLDSTIHLRSPTAVLWTLSVQSSPSVDPEMDLSKSVLPIPRLAGEA